MKLEFQQAGVNSLVDDFLHPPTDMDTAGLLSIHYDGHVEHVAVSKSVGKTISLPGSKMSVEVAEYIPNAIRTADGHFVSQGSEPRNPQSGAAGSSSRPEGADPANRLRHNAFS